MRLGRCKLVRRALGMRPLAALARNLPPVRGIKRRKATRPLLFHASLQEGAKETSPAGKCPAPRKGWGGASQALHPVLHPRVIEL
jgi:hypothetical protein